MTTRASQLGASLDRAYRHWRERGVLGGTVTPEQPPPRMTVAISRQRGAAGRTVARMLSKQLDWPVYDSELIEHIAKEAGVHKVLLEELDEARPTWFSEVLKSLSAGRSVSGAGYANLLHKLLAALYVKGNCIIVGRGAAQVLPQERTLRIRLIAPFEHRVRRMAGMLEPTEDAVKHVKQVDRDRRQFVQQYFHMDADDCQGYDATIDTSRFELSTCCEIVERLLAGRIAMLQEKEK